MSTSRPDAPPPGGPPTEDEMQFFFDLSLDLLCIADFEGHFTRLNPAWEAALGYTREELMAAPYVSFIHPDDVDATAAEAAKIRSGSVTLRFENRYRKKDGGYVWLLWHARPDMERGVIYACARDVTQEKSMEQQVLSTSRMQRAILDGTDFSIISTDAHGIIQTFNAVAQRNLGYSAEEVIGRATPALFHDAAEIGRHAERLSQELGRHVEPGLEAFVAKASMGLPDEGEWTYIRKDGSCFPGQASVTALRDQQGGIAGFVGVSRDITARKESEEALRSSQLRLRLALESARIAEWELSLATGAARRSLHHDQIFGYDEMLPEWTYEIFLKHVHPDDRSRVDESFRKSVSTGEDWQFECRIIQKDGTQRWIWARGSIFQDVSGAPTSMLGIVGDITERKSVEEALRESEERMRLATEAAGIAVWEWDVNSNTLKWDDGSFAMYGLTPTPDGRTTVEDWKARVLPEDFPAQEARLLHTLATCGRDQREFRIVRASDQAVRVIQAAEMVTAGSDGRPARMVGINIDITERKALEQQLIETTRLQRAILDGANFTIISTRPDGIIQTFNAEAERELGYESGELIGKVTPAVIHLQEEVVQRAETLSRELGIHVEPGFESFVAKARLGLPDENDWTYIRKDGSRYPVRLSVTALCDESGSITGFLGVGSNISERIRAEAARREAEARLQGILDNTTAVIFIKDLAGRYRLINRRWGDLFHITPEEILGRTDQDVFPPEMARAFRENDLLVQESGVPQILEEVAPHDDGPHTYVSVKFPLRDASGQITAVGGIATDITDRKGMEDDLRRSNEALEQFAYIASHDLQEPLRIVVNYLQLLERRCKPQLSEEAGGFIDTAINSADRMRTLIQDLLEFSRIGRRSRPLAPVDAGKVLDEVLANMKITLDESGAVIEREGRLPRVIADEGQLGQVFQNLIGNAVRFHGQKPPRIHIGARREKGAWTFFVRDEGVGIDPKFFGRIFEIFRRLDAREDGGTGIGLAICKRIIEGHGGRIWVESAPGEGATFLFSLRAVARQARQPHDPDA